MQPQPGPNILLTGIPRSGTTLACRLLSECPGVVALNEPIAGDRFTDRARSLNAVEQSFRAIRASIEFHGKAPVRANKGEITDNAFDANQEKRENVLRRTMVSFEPRPQPGFTLIMKHNAEFTLLMPEILERFPCFAIVRNPLAVLASWDSVELPVSKGNVSKSQRLLPAFHRELNHISTLLEKQLFILNWYFRQFESLPRENILRYEDIIDSNGAALEKIIEQKTPTHWQLTGRNANVLYDAEKVTVYYHALMHNSGPWWEFYSPRDLELLTDQLCNP